MHVEVINEGAVTVMVVSGSLVVGDSERRMTNTVDQLLSAGRVRLVIDLAGVDAIDSAGLGSLVRAVSASRDAGGEAKLANPSERTRRLLDVTLMSSVFEIYENAEAALGSFARA